MLLSSMKLGILVFSTTRSRTLQDLTFSQIVGIKNLDAKFNKFVKCVFDCVTLQTM